MLLLQASAVALDCFLRRSAAHKSICIPMTLSCSNDSDFKQCCPAAHRLALHLGRNLLVRFLHAVLLYFKNDCPLLVSEGLLDVAEGSGEIVEAALSLCARISVDDAAAEELQHKAHSGLPPCFRAQRRASNLAMQS